MSKERRLGRGLEALLGRVPNRVEEPAQQTPQTEGITRRPAPEQPPAQKPPVIATDPGPQPPAEPPQFAMPDPPPQPPHEDLSAPGPRPLQVGEIDSNPAQPREDFDADELQALSDSLTTHGLLQPVVVRRVDDRYQLIAGERRLRAAQHAGWTEVPATVIEADDRESAELAIVENLQRKDLNPLEKAASFQRYLEQYDCTQEELASRLKLDRSTIANLIRLLELPEPVQAAIRGGEITQGHARAPLPLGDEAEQVDFCRRIQQESLNVRQTESLVQEKIAAADQRPLGVVGRDGQTSRPGRTQSEHLASLEQEFRAALGTKVRITHGAKGRGKLVIHFGSHDEFERIRQYLTGPQAPAAQPHAG